MANRVYDNFDLEIERASKGNYRARVLASPEGETSWVHVSIPALSERAEGLLLGATRQDRQSSRDAMVPPIPIPIPAGPQAKVLVEFGSALFDAAFCGDVGTRWAASLASTRERNRRLRLRLRLTEAPELTGLPWEFLYQRSAGDFLALSELTPVVRYLHVANPQGSLHVDPPLRILAFTALPSDLTNLDAESEITLVRKAVAELESFGRVELEHVASGRYEDLQTALDAKDFHVLHYIGHGGYDSEVNTGTLALVGPDGKSLNVGADDFARLLADHRSSLRLVVLNSCRGAHGDRRDPFAGTAQRLLHQGISAVVAMQFSITDRGAIAFGSNMYRALADGSPLDAAMSDARTAIKRETGSVEWATPVLYLRAHDGVVFDVAQATTAIPGRATYPHAEARRLARIVLDSPMVASEADQAALVKALAGKTDSTKTFVPWVADVIQRGLTKELLAALQARAVGEEQLLAVEEVRQGWNRLDWISAPLEVFSARVDFQAVISAYRRAVPAGRARRVDSLAEALDAAADFGPQETRECPLYRMVVILEHLAAVQVDDWWFGLESDQLDGLRSDAERWVEESQGRLVIDLRSGGTPPGVPPWPSTVVAYVYRRLPDGWTWERREERCKPSLEGVQDAVRSHLSAAEADLSSFAVGFILPRMLFGSTPESWLVPIDFDDPSPLGLEHPVVLHSGERLSMPRLHQNWARRAGDVQRRLKSGPADIRWIESALRDNLPAMRLMVSKLDTALIGFGFVPGASPVTLIGDTLLAAVGAGVPYLLWVEEEPGDWKDVYDFVGDLLSGGSLDSLAERLRDERVLKGDPLARGVRLIWDDPMRLPESLRPSRPNGDILGQERGLNA